MDVHHCAVWSGPCLTSLLRLPKEPGAWFEQLAELKHGCLDQEHRLPVNSLQHIRQDCWVTSAWNALILITSHQLRVPVIELSA